MAQLQRPTDMSVDGQSSQLSTDYATETPTTYEPQETDTSSHTSGKKGLVTKIKNTMKKMKNKLKHTGDPAQQDEDGHAGDADNDYDEDDDDDGVTPGARETLQTSGGTGAGGAYGTGQQGLEVPPVGQTDNNDLPAIVDQQDVDGQRGDGIPENIIATDKNVIITDRLIVEKGCNCQGNCGENCSCGFHQDSRVSREEGSLHSRSKDFALDGNLAGQNSAQQAPEGGRRGDQLSTPGPAEEDISTKAGGLTPYARSEHRDLEGLGEGAAAGAGLGVLGGAAVGHGGAANMDSVTEGETLPTNRDAVDQQAPKLASYDSGFESYEGHLGNLRSSPLSDSGFVSGERGFDGVDAVDKDGLNLQGNQASLSQEGYGNKYSASNQAGPEELGLISGAQDLSAVDTSISAGKLDLAPHQASISQEGYANFGQGGEGQSQAREIAAANASNEGGVPTEGVTNLGQGSAEGVTNMDQSRDLKEPIDRMAEKLNFSEGPGASAAGGGGQSYLPTTTNVREQAGRLGESALAAGSAATAAVGLSKNQQQGKSGESLPTGEATAGEPKPTLIQRAMETLGLASHPAHATEEHSPTVATGPVATDRATTGDLSNEGVDGEQSSTAETGEGVKGSALAGTGTVAGAAQSAYNYMTGSGGQGAGNTESTGPSLYERTMGTANQGAAAARDTLNSAIEQGKPYYNSSFLGRATGQAEQPENDERVASL